MNGIKEMAKSSEEVKSGLKTYLKREKEKQQNISTNNSNDIGNNTNENQDVTLFDNCENASKDISTSTEHVNRIGGR